jgi:hypothetical protein
MVMKQRILLPMLMAAVVGFCPAPALAQPPAPLPTQDITVRIERNAETTRDLLRNILRTYPDAVGEILRRDPSLMSRADYMAAYPELTQFLTIHPEVQRNVEYYFEGYAGWQSRHQLDPEFEALGVLLGGMAGVFVFAGLISVFAWLVRAVIQHRRWLKASQVQADVHTKLMERMTTNEELLAYIQSPAGRRFLEATPVRPETESAATNAPIGPIIWSMMAGIVLSTVGAGFRYSASFIADEAHQAFVVVGVIVLALGMGFIFAALMAFAVSSRLGLFPPRRAAETTPGNA